MPIEFKRIDVAILSPGSPPNEDGRVAIYWELHTTLNDLDRTTFFVERSTSPGFPEDDTEVISDPNGIEGVANLFVYSFMDITTNLFNFWRNYYYRIRAEIAPRVVNEREVVPAQKVVSRVRTWESMLRPFESEIIWRHDWILKYVQGIPCYVFIERTSDAPRCPACWDSTAQRVTRSNCTLCLGVGYQRPYLDPIQVYADFNPDQQVTQVAEFGEIQSKQKDSWFSAYPKLKPGDLVYQVMQGNVYNVETVHPVQPQGITIFQIARLSALSRDDVAVNTLMKQIDEVEISNILAEWHKVRQERMF